MVPSKTDISLHIVNMEVVSICVIISSRLHSMPFQISTQARGH